MPIRERNKFVKRNQVLELKIEDYAFGGKGIARIHSDEGSFVVFVPNTLPGQLVKAQIKKSGAIAAETKNDCMRRDGFSPSQWILAQYPLRPGSLREESEWGQLGVLAAQIDSRTAFAVKAQMRFTAQK